MADLKVGYINVFVSNFEAALSFYRDVLELNPTTVDPDFGYAAFDAGPISFAFAKADDPALIGRHTGVGFIVADVDAAYEDLKARGVTFEMPPTQQPWGGVLALFNDPDGNVYYLDPGHAG